MWDCVFSVDGAFLVTGESFAVIGFGYFVLYLYFYLYFIYAVVVSGLINCSV